MPSLVPGEQVLHGLGQHVRGRVPETRCGRPRTRADRLDLGVGLRRPSRGPAARRSGGRARPRRRTGPVERHPGGGERVGGRRAGRDRHAGGDGGGTAGRHGSSGATGVGTPMLSTVGERLGSEPVRLPARYAESGEHGGRVPPGAARPQQPGQLGRVHASSSRGGGTSDRRRRARAFRRAGTPEPVSGAGVGPDAERAEVGVLRKVQRDRGPGSPPESRARLAAVARR